MTAPSEKDGGQLEQAVPTRLTETDLSNSHVIATPGEGSADPPYGLLGSLARSILNAIPGSTNVSVPYNHADPVGTRQADGAVSRTSSRR